MAIRIEKMRNFIKYRAQKMQETYPQAFRDHINLGR